jgi:hypothetical protein
LTNKRRQKDIGTINECLNRIVVGLAVNSSVDAKELLLYVYSTAAPFLYSRAEGSAASARRRAQR